MNRSKVLITGCCGFIGFHVTNKFLKYYQCYGVDNLNDYYDTNLKLDRLKILKKNGLLFNKIDITNKKSLLSLIKKHHFKYVIHLAAQAGVRYSFENPTSYIDTNIIGTFNLYEILKDTQNKNTHIISASTSSVYGYSNKKSFKENDEHLFQLSLYSASKKSMESIIHNYSYNFKINSTVLRFFNVYGPWGRPDMAIFKFVTNIIKDRPIEVYNRGKMYRDFTYIDDLVEGIHRISRILPYENTRVKNDTLSPVAPFRIVNIGNQKTVYLNDFIKKIELVIGKKSKKVLMPMQKGDVYKTLSNSNLLKKLTGYSPATKIDNGVKFFYNWYKTYYNM